ncbi:ester cyclase [Streptomyces sp. NBC_00083]|uniref:ester cyclase n=1 Tax=Streptomyces sp. NBC_00083 TaxID=2975647 RepID=UPI00224E79E3|nr:ester cyclase [Streptomyces sp. NBC_00083]MCX5385100.1 ester cyclase [Streptomyces sp. NBC_00083]
MTFTQVIDFRTEHFGDLDRLMDRWIDQTKGRRTASHSLIGKDRADRNHFVEIIEFPSYEEAMANSKLPETDRIFAEMVALCDGAPTFTDLDVVRNDQLNASTARRFFHEIASGGNLDAIGEVFADDYADHDPLKDEDTVVGSDGIRSDVAGWRAAFDFTFELDRQICEGDDVVTLWTLRGTHTGEFMGFAATGRPFSVTGTTIFRFKNDLIQEGWWHWNAMTLMKQLGLSG